MFGAIRNEYKKYDFIGKADIRDTITVEGQGKVTGVPDIATIEVGVLTEDKEVGKAQNANTEKMNKLIDKIKSFSVDAKDIQTTNYSIYPQYDYPDGKQVLKGYQVNQSVTVKIRKMDLISEVLGAVGESGANQVSGVTFKIDDPEALKAQARDKAIENAYTKARELASKMHLRLGKISFFNEYSNDIAQKAMYGYGLGAGGDSMIAAPAPQVETGSQEVIVNVSIGWELL